MAHGSVREAYRRLTERLNKFPQGVVPSQVLFDILRLLFTEREAELVALLPLRPFTVAQAARAWQLPETATRQVLETLADRAILVDADMDGTMFYTVPPPMAGFFEFSLMRVGAHPDQKLLSELYYQYMNVEEDFIKSLFCHGETQLGRLFVNEAVLTNEQALHVLDFERASRVIEQASTIAVGTCYCRHKQLHLGKACSAPLEVCLTFDYTGDSLVRHGHARRIETSEALAILTKSRDHGLVQFGENAQDGVHFICNCCKCCCEALQAAQRFGSLQPIHTTNYLARISPSACRHCQACQAVCPVVAIENGNDGSDLELTVLEERCLGCGLCVKACPHGAMQFERRPETILTPVDTTHRIVSMAIERGTLQYLLFDEQAFWSHRALAAIVGVVLALPPFKQLLACQQVKSRYLGRLCRRYPTRPLSRSPLPSSPPDEVE